MNNGYGISILIPLYNGIEFLKESLTSIKKQTYTKWEVIIGVNGVDKDSDIFDNAISIVNDLKILNTRVLYYTTNGKAQTLNTMINDVKYDYIALLDVDDVWIYNKLEIQVPFLTDYDVVGTNCEYFGDRTDKPVIPFGDFTYKHNFFLANPLINSSIIMKKNDAYWNENEFLEDYDLWLRLFYERRKFYNIQDVLCKHRIHKSSAFNNVNSNYINELRTKWLNKMFGNMNV